VADHKQTVRKRHDTVGLSKQRSAGRI